MLFLKTVNCLRFTREWCCVWCRWCYCFNCNASRLKFVKSDSRKSKARPNLICFSRNNTFVMKSAGLSWVDTLRTRSRPIFSHSCTANIVSSTCIILPSPLRLLTASLLCESVQSGGTVYTAILAKFVPLQSLQLLLSRWRTTRLLRSSELSCSASVPSLALRSREREMLLHCNFEEFLSARTLWLSSLRYRREQRYCFFCFTTTRAKQVMGKLLEPSHCYHRHVSHWLRECVHAVLNVWTMMTEEHCLTHACFESSCVTHCKWLFDIVVWCLADGFWKETCFGI